MTYIEFPKRVISTLSSASDASKDHVIAGADSVYDDDLQKKQSTINAELYNMVESAGGMTVEEKAKLDSLENRVLTFNNIIELTPLDILSLAAGNPPFEVDAVVWCSQNKRFYGKVASTVHYCATWNGSDDYMTGNPVSPRTDRIYLYDGHSYVWDGTNLVMSGEDLENVAFLGNDEEIETAEFSSINDTLHVNANQELSFEKKIIAQQNMFDKSANLQDGGLGRKVLGKNIVSGTNVLTSNMLDLQNTIYVIQYDYDLNDTTVTVPEGSILSFEGGSISNGTLAKTTTPFYVIGVNPGDAIMDCKKYVSPNTINGRCGSYEVVEGNMKDNEVFTLSDSESAYKIGQNTIIQNVRLSGNGDSSITETSEVRHGSGVSTKSPTAPYPQHNVFKNLSVNYFDKGINLYRNGYATVEDCWIINNNIGVNIDTDGSWVGALSIRDSHFYKNQTGIKISDKVTNMTVHVNKATFEGCLVGIDCAGNATIKDCYFGDQGTSRYKRDNRGGRRVAVVHPGATLVFEDCSIGLSGTWMHSQYNGSKVIDGQTYTADPNIYDIAFDLLGTDEKPCKVILRNCTLSLANMLDTHNYPSVLDYPTNTFMYQSRSTKNSIVMENCTVNYSPANKETSWLYHRLYTGNLLDCTQYNTEILDDNNDPIPSKVCKLECFSNHKNYMINGYFDDDVQNTLLNNSKTYLNELVSIVLQDKNIYGGHVVRIKRWGAYFYYRVPNCLVGKPMTLIIGTRGYENMGTTIINMKKSDFANIDGSFDNINIGALAISGYGQEPRLADYRTLMFDVMPTKEFGKFYFNFNRNDNNVDGYIDVDFIKLVEPSFKNLADKAESVKGELIDYMINDDTELDNLDESREIYNHKIDAFGTIKDSGKKMVLNKSLPKFVRPFDGFINVELTIAQQDENEPQTQPEPLTLVQDAINQAADHIYFYTYGGRNIFIALVGNNYYTGWNGSSYYTSLSDFDAFRYNGEVYIHNGANNPLYKLNTGEVCMPETMLSKPNTTYVILHDYTLGGTSTKTLHFDPSTLSTVKTEEKQKLDDCTTEYNTCVTAKTNAENFYNTKLAAYNTADSAYTANPTDENFEALEAAGIEKDVAYEQLKQADKDLTNATKRKNSAAADYAAINNQDYLSWTSIYIEAAHVLHLTGRAVRLNSEGTSIISTDSGMLYSISGGTYYIGCLAGDFSYKYERYIGLPAGCTLEFDGGSISGGTLIGNNTQIQAPCKPIFTNVNLGGTWNVPEITSAWFSDATQTNGLKLVFALQNETILNTITIEPGTYSVALGTNDSTALKCLSNLNLIINGNINLEANSLDAYSIISCKGVNHVNISGSGSIAGDKQTHITETGEWGYGILLYGSNFVTIKDLKVKDCWGDCIYIGGTGAANIIINNCDIDNARRNGISVTNGYNIVVQNCKILNIGGTNPQAAIDIETNTNKYASNILVSNNFIDNCLLGVTIYGRSNYTKTSIAIENNYINCTWRAVAVNGISTCVLIKNNELRALYNVVDANTVDSTQDNVILFENNMVYQTAIPTAEPYNLESRMCAFYTMKGDYLFLHNNINTVMPVFRFASGNKYIKDNTIECPTLFADHPRGCRNVNIINNKITGNVQIPGMSCRLHNNIINGYLRSTLTDVRNSGCIISDNTITHPETGSTITATWEATLTDSYNASTDNINKKCELNGKNIVVKNNTLKNVSLKIGGGTVECNNISYNQYFTLTALLLSIGHGDFLHNTVKYSGTNSQNSNIYIVDFADRIIGNVVTASSRIQYVFYHTDGSFISGNTIQLPSGHPVDHIVDSLSCTRQIAESMSGTSEKRPILPLQDGYYVGHHYFDTTLSKDIVWKGTNWVYCDGTRVTWPITFALTNISANNTQLPDNGQSYTTVLQANEDYTLPSTITVTMGGNTLTEGSGNDYTYDNNSSSDDYGKIVINNVSGAVTITASGDPVTV